MKTVMRFTKVKEKIKKDKAINSTDEGKGRHRKVIRIGAFALVFVVLFSFVSTFFKMTDAVNIATIEGFYKEPKNTIDTRLGYQERPAVCTNQCSEKLSPDSIRRLWFLK